MADIELVIKIPKELYESYKGRPPMLGDVGMDMIAQSIANGTPLPKGYRLMDTDAFINGLKGVERLHIDDELRNSILDIINTSILVEDVKMAESEDKE